ncbi:MAG: hypothetical protein AB8F78_07450 [Saprospiraceae bacterium]
MSRQSCIMISSLKRLPLLFSILGLTFLLCGCPDDPDPCAVPRDGENYLLSDTAVQYIETYEGVSRVIFETETNEEIVFDVSRFDAIGSYQRVGVCAANASGGQTVIGTSQLIEVVLSNDSLFLESFFITLSEAPTPPNTGNQESLIVSVGKLFSNDYGPGDGLFGYRIDQNNPDVDYTDSLTINGRTFYGLYQTNLFFDPPKYEVMYTMNEGVVFIKHVLSGTEYVYKRKE